MFLYKVKKPVLIWLFLFIISCDSNNLDSDHNIKKDVRIITLSPHLAELVFSAGAIDNLVGVTSYSDYPEQVKSIRHIGDSFKLDYESIVSLQADYILSWKGGTPTAVVEKLQSLGLTVIETEINALADIPKTVIQIAELTNTQVIAAENTQQFTTELELLKGQNHVRKSVFIEISDKPLYTVSGKHWMSEAASICNYENVFNDLSQISAPISLESVIGRDPQMILNISPNVDKQWFDWPTLEAVKNNHLITIHPDIFSRPSFRILKGISKLCAFDNP